MRLQRHARYQPPRPSYRLVLRESDLQWLRSCSRWFSMQLTRCCSSSTCAAAKMALLQPAACANIWLRERVKWIRVLVRWRCRSMPYQSRAMMTAASESPTSSPTMTAAIWKNIEQNSAAGELDLMETWDSHHSSLHDQWGSVGQMPEFKTREARITGSWA